VGDVTERVAVPVQTADLGVVEDGRETLGRIGRR
jgi:hypothetical protein